MYEEENLEGPLVKVDDPKNVGNIFAVRTHADERIY